MIKGGSHLVDIRSGSFKIGNSIYINRETDNIPSGSARIGMRSSKLETLHTPVLALGEAAFLSFKHTNNKERETGCFRVWRALVSHYKWECSDLNEVFKIGNSTYTSTGIGRGGIFKFQTYIQ
jgi:hypothetical protein